MSLLPCPGWIYLGPEEPFNIAHGWALTLSAEENLGEWTFEVAVNGVVQKSTLYHRVHHDSDPTSVSRTFDVQFPNGLEHGDRVEGFWYAPDGLRVYCDTTVFIADPG